MTILKYIPDFRQKCIEIFESNLPRFFALGELQLFTNFIDHDVDDNYYVVQVDGDIVACGGIFLRKNSDEAGLSWGMVHANHHKKGIGKAFTEYRIILLKELYPDKVYRIDTSQHTEGFYLKRGFKTIEVIPDGFSKGLDQYVMKME